MDMLGQARASGARYRCENMQILEKPAILGRAFILTRTCASVQTSKSRITFRYSKVLHSKMVVLLVPTCVSPTTSCLAPLLPTTSSTAPMIGRLRQHWVSTQHQSALARLLYGVSLSGSVLFSAQHQ